MANHFIFHLELALLLLARVVLRFLLDQFLLVQHLLALVAFALLQLLFLAGNLDFVVLNGFDEVVAHHIFLLVEQLAFEGDLFLLEVEQFVLDVFVDLLVELADSFLLHDLVAQVVGLVRELLLLVEGLLGLVQTLALLVLQMLLVLLALLAVFLVVLDLLDLLLVELILGGGLEGLQLHLFGAHLVGGVDLHLLGVFAQVVVVLRNLLLVVVDECVLVLVLLG